MFLGQCLEKNVDKNIFLVIRKNLRNDYYLLTQYGTFSNFPLSQITSCFSVDKEW